MAGAGEINLCRLSLRRAVLDFLDYCIEIGIACTKLLRETISAALRNLLAVRNHLELTGRPRWKDGP